MLLVTEFHQCSFYCRTGQQLWLLILKEHLLKKWKENLNLLEIRFSFYGNEKFSGKREKKIFSKSNPWIRRVGTETLKLFPVFPHFSGQACQKNLCPCSCSSTASGNSSVRIHLFLPNICTEKPLAITVSNSFATYSSLQESVQDATAILPQPLSQSFIFSS